MGHAHPDGSDERRHIALVGFMGSGKTSVGKILAERLGAPFVDLDETISRKAGRTIAEIFREHGEVGFRAHERAALREVLESSTPLVLATGGGTFADASMRRWVRTVARTVYLKASPEVLFARIGAGSARAVRPLLAGPDPLATIRRLLTERTPAYEESDVTVTAERASAPEIVEEILDALKTARQRSTRRERTGASDVRPSDDEARASRSALAVETTLTSRGAARKPMVPLAPEGDDDAIEMPHAAIGADGSTLLRVHSSQGAYPVELRPEAGPWLADAIAAVCPGERLALISDTTVAELHAAPLERALAEHGKRTSRHLFPPGENSKTLATVGALYDELLLAGLGRTDAIVALGGGVVGDVAGFVAATFLRGIPYVQVPTTTLAAVDSSVGGKTGVNTPRGKNLVGSFHAPRAVLLAGSHLATQTQRQHAAGLVEAVKMAAALDARAFAAFVEDAPALLAFDPTALLRTIARAIALKGEVVCRDEREGGDRAVLNYGHTVGHAVEVGEAYRLLHGEAVGLGMLAEASWAESAGLARDVFAPLATALAALGAPTEWRDAHIDLTAMGFDKKRQGASVRIPVVPELGRFELRSVPLVHLVEFCENRSAPA